MDMICSYTYDQYCDKVMHFHGGLAPGMIVAGFMVDLARRQLPSDTIFDVICETSACLPDAVQLLTPCTVGNQWMKIIDVSRYAMTLYDKHTGEGIRVYLDIDKLDRWPEIKDWFLKLKSKNEQDRDILIAEIMEAGTDILSFTRLNVSQEFLARKEGKPVSVCPLCNEAFKSYHGAICPACKDDFLPYDTGSVISNKQA